MRFVDQSAAHNKQRHKLKWLVCPTCVRTWLLPLGDSATETSGELAITVKFADETDNLTSAAPQRHLQARLQAVKRICTVNAKLSIKKINKVRLSVPLVGFMYLAFTRLPGESYRRRLRSLLCLCDWLMIAYIALFSALLSRLTALACDSTWVTNFL